MALPDPMECPSFDEIGSVVHQRRRHLNWTTHVLLIRLASTASAEEEEKERDERCGSIYYWPRQQSGD